MTTRGEAMRRVPLKHIKEQDILAQTVHDHLGRVLLKKGNRLNKELIHKIGEHNVKSVYIADNFNDIDSLKEVISPQIRSEAVLSIKTIYSDFVSPSRQSKKIKKTFRENPYIEKLMRTADKLLDEVIINKDGMIEMAHIKSLDNYKFEHAVNISIYSLLLGLEIYLKEEELKTLVLAGLLMDIGNNYIDQDLLTKSYVYSDAERKAMQDHVELSFSYLTDNTDLNMTTRHIISQHHERIDGSGYPKGEKGDKIHKLAKILAIAEAYDSLTSDRYHRDAYPPNEALELIMASAGSLFEFDYVNQFAKHVIAYPVGTYIMLSNGDQGSVLYYNDDIPLRPVVMILKHANSNDKYLTIDLAIDLNCTVDRVIYQIE